MVCQHCTNLHGHLSEWELPLYSVGSKHFNTHSTCHLNRWYSQQHWIQPSFSASYSCPPLPVTTMISTPSPHPTNINDDVMPSPTNEEPQQQSPTVETFGEPDNVWPFPVTTTKVYSPIMVTGRGRNTSSTIALIAVMVVVLLQYTSKSTNTHCSGVPIFTKGSP